jgi:serine/threonine protein kinase
MEVDNVKVRSAPESPNSSGLGFDLKLHERHALTNSSLNVVLDKSSDENDGKPRNDAEDWVNKGGASRIIRNSGDGGGQTVITRNVNDFTFGKQLGEGSYSTVVLATDKHTKKQYAVKILDKRHIIKEKKVKYVNIEKHALNRLTNRMGIISLYFTFQDKSSLYFVLDYAANGELLSLIKKNNTINEDCTRHFGAQILDAIKFMHDNGVIHRDIKPENILLDDKLRIQITDFGTARLLEKKTDDSEEYPVDVRAKSFVGTAEYVSPELLESKYCGKPGDIWAFGCILYQMIAGKPPFKATNEYLTFQKITKLQYAFSAGFPLIIRDLIKQILVLQPSRRATIDQIQKHHFFLSVDFTNFDQIWNTPPPEITPYKMTAKSMMKVPELQKSQSQPIIVTRKPMPHRNSESLLKKDGNEDFSASTSTTQSSLSSNGKALNPAAAAAFALHKRDSNQDVEEESRKSTASSRVLTEQDYIPGTNILRPVINTRTNFARAAAKKNQTANTKAKSKVLDVAPRSSVEQAWKQYLNHRDERILKIGPVIIHREQTEPFEKKNKGQLHNTPINLASKLQETNSKNGTGRESFLSKVINGSSTGLRGYESDDNLVDNEVEPDESDSITDYFEIEETELEKSPETKENKSGIRSALFKKILQSANSSTETDIQATPTRQHPLEKPRTCTVIITTHGRVLIFFRNDQEANYRLISEIKLNYPFIQLKEISGTPSKFSKLLPAVGVFAILSKQTTFVFEVEKYEVNLWTDAIAKAKINQYEREKELNETRRNKSGNSSVKSPVLSGAGNERPSTPKQTNSPSFADTSPGKPVTPKTPVNDTKSKNNGQKYGDDKQYNLMLNKIKGKPVRRRPPPPMSPTIDMSTGFLSSNGDSEFLHAAQLAVAQSPKPSTHHSEGGRHSSFTKSGGEHKPTVKHNPNHSRDSDNSQGSKPMITSLNSKFLARSSRKK